MRQALTVLMARFRTADKKILADQLADIYGLIDRLKSPEAGCVCSQDLIRPVEPFLEPPAAPFKADLALTYACNNACGHCYNENGRKKMASLSVDKWLKVLERLRQIGIPHVIFTGGEPTLMPFLPKLAGQAAGLGLVPGLITNGRLLSNLSLVRDLKGAGLDHVQITLESPDPATHEAMTGARSFEQTVKGIENCLKSGLHTITNTTLTSRNKDQALILIEYLAGLGLKTLAMNGMICAGRGRGFQEALTEEELGPLLTGIREKAGDLGLNFLWYTPTAYCRLSPVELDIGVKRCNAAEYSICIEPDGRVLPCQSYYQPCGHILNDSWDTIWNSELFRTIRNRIKNPREAGLARMCWDCPDLTVCGGGCPLK